MRHSPILSAFSFAAPSAILALLALSLGAGDARSQAAVDLPRASPAATVSQTFGYTTATVTYSRPAVKGRAIWGGLVPYGQVWRAGANAATTLELTTDARINGQPLPKGIYGVFILPTEKDWTFIISKTSKTWGSFTYDAKDDALRVNVAPAAAEPMERLEYGFESISDSGATLTLHWDKLKASLPILVEFLETGKAKINEGLAKAKATPNEHFEWMNAARFYWDYNVDRKQAMEWIDKSIKVKPVHNNLWLKAEWLAAAGKVKDAKKAAKLAREAAAKDPANAYAVTQIDKSVAKWDEAVGKK
jgi:Protein of unknown function (DUF2911)